MARRRKHRTHLKAPADGGDNVPRSFIIKHGQVGSSLSQLIRDLRKVMEPNTAGRLKASRILSYFFFFYVANNSSRSAQGTSLKTT